MSFDAHELVSIGLPVFNGEAYLSEAIESLLGQTHTNIELIISDNASTDGTESIARKYAKADSRVVYFRQEENRGPSFNYLFTLDQATGRFFMWAAHDDIWALNWIEVLLLELGKNDVGVRGELQLFDSNGILREKRLPDFPRNSLVKYFFSDESEYKVHYIYSLFDTLKLRAANVNALFNNYCPDGLFVFSLLQFGALRCTQATHLMYRVHPDNLGRTYTSKWKGWRKIVYRVHPLRYYLDYVKFTTSSTGRTLISLTIPFKHIYAQTFFWYRGARELLFRRKFY